MAIVTFDIPNAIITELNVIAVKNGFANAKAMVTAYLRATIKASRVGALDFKSQKESAENQSDTDTSSIS